MPLELEGVGHFITDFEGLRNKAPGNNALEGFEAVGVVNEVTNLLVDQVANLRIGGQFGCGGFGASSLTEVLERRHNQSRERFLILTDDHALIDE